MIEQTVGIHVRADVLSGDLLSVCKQVGHIYKLIVPLYYIECHLFGSLFGRDALRLLILYEATGRLKETIRRFAIISQIGVVLGGVDSRDRSEYPSTFFHVLFIEVVQLDYIIGIVAIHR